MPAATRETVPAFEAQAPREFVAATPMAQETLPAQREFVAAPPTVQETPPAPRPAAAPAPVELERVLSESDLQMVQTRSDAKVESMPEPEFVPAKRERKAPPSEASEPLVQIETRRE